MECGFLLAFCSREMDEIGISTIPEWVSLLFCFSKVGLKEHLLCWNSWVTFCQLDCLQRLLVLFSIFFPRATRTDPLGGLLPTTRNAWDKPGTQPWWWGRGGHRNGHQGICEHTAPSTMGGRSPVTWETTLTEGDQALESVSPVPAQPLLGCLTVGKVATSLCFRKMGEQRHLSRRIVRI